MHLNKNCRVLIGDPFRADGTEIEIIISVGHGPTMWMDNAYNISQIGRPDPLMAFKWMAKKNATMVIQSPTRIKNEQRFIVNGKPAKYIHGHGVSCERWCPSTQGSQAQVLQIQW